MTVRRTNSEEVRIGLEALREFCGVLDSLATESNHSHPELASIMEFVENLTPEQRGGVTAVYEFSRRISSLLR